jgi:hypothetical protein
MDIEKINALDEIDNCLAQAKALASCLAHASHKDSDIDNLTINNIAFTINEYLHKVIQLKNSDVLYEKKSH